MAHMSLCPHLTDSMSDMDLKRMQIWNRKKKLQHLKCEMSLFLYQADSSDFIVTRTAVPEGIHKLVS